MLQKLDANHHSEPMKGPFSITRIFPGKTLATNTKDPALGPLSNIDHATMKKGLTIKMHEHINDEILSYVWRGVSHHKDSAGLEEPISRGKLMLMNAGESFWHEEKVKKDEVEMLQIFIRPREANLSPHIQFHEKPTHNRDWYLIAGPENSEAPLFVRQQAYILDAHPKAGDEMTIPHYEGFVPFLYCLDGEIRLGDTAVSSQEAVIDLEQPLPPLTAIYPTTLVLFFVHLNVPMAKDGTISGVQNLT